MIEDVVVEPMTEEFILWRCLHSGPLTRETMDLWPSDSEMPWERYRIRNVPLLLKLCRTYGACAIILTISSTATFRLLHGLRTRHLQFIA